MKTHDAELMSIKDLLRDNPKGMKITRIARALAMNRNAAAKFLEILLMTGQVEMLEHGMSKIFILSRRTSIPTMLDRSEDFILVLDQDMKISQVNDNYLKFTGSAREALLGRRPDTANLPVIGKKPVFDRIREAHYGTDIRTEVSEVMSGEERIFDIRLTPTVFNDGKRGITIIAGDITQVKQRERSLKESEANFRTLFGESPIGTAVFGLSGELRNANPAFLEVFGVKSRESLTLLNLFSMNGIPPGTKAALETGKKVTFESGIGQVPGNPGDAVPVMRDTMSFKFLVTPINLENGEREKGYLVQLHENRVRPGEGSDRATSENRRMMEDVLSCIDDAVILVHAGTAVITFVNPAAGKMFGYSPGECLGKNPGLLFGTEGTIPGLPTSGTAGGGSGGYHETVSRLKKRDGVPFPVHIQFRPISNDAGVIDDIVMIIRDLSRFEGAAPHPLHDDAGLRIPLAVRGFAPESGHYRPVI